MKQTVFLDGKGVRDPRKEYRANASPKRLSTNLISGQWSFEDTTTSVDLVIPWSMNTGNPVVLATLSTIGTGPVSVAGWSFTHPEHKKTTVALRLLGANGKEWMKKLTRKVLVQFLIDGR